MNKLAVFIAAVAVAVPVVLAVFWLLWMLWCAVMPALWPTGPQQLIQPNYWLFVGAWILARFLGGAIFGRSSTKD